MFDDQPRRLSCPRDEALHCPTEPCPGRLDPGVCSHLKTLRAWRTLSREEQRNQLGEGRPSIDPALRDAVNACPSRGSVLPISMQDDCGCSGKELSECRDGRGTIPGRVTLRDCLACQKI